MQSVNFVCIEGWVFTPPKMYAYKGKRDRKNKYYTKFKVLSIDYFESKPVKKEYVVRCYGNLCQEVMDNLKTRDKVFIIGSFEERGVAFIHADVIVKSPQIFKHTTKPGIQKKEAPEGYRPEDYKSKEEVFVEAKEQD